MDLKRKVYTYIAQYHNLKFVIEVYILTPLQIFHYGYKMYTTFEVLHYIVI